MHHFALKKKTAILMISAPVKSGVIVEGKEFVSYLVMLLFDARLWCPTQIM